MDMNCRSHDSTDGLDHQGSQLSLQNSARDTNLRRRRTPSDYAKTVSKHSTRSEHDSLYPGVQYRSIVKFLNSTGQHHGTKSRTPDPPFPKREHSFAILHDLAYDRQDPQYFTTFNDPQALFCHPAPRKDCGQLLFLRGYPSHTWMNTIGARYRIDPEVFRRQLQQVPGSDYYDLPDLPSSSINIIKLSTTTIGYGEVPSSSRHEHETQVQDHFNNLGKSGLIGESIVRQLWNHDEMHFSIEQNIIVNVVRRQEGWLALILLDHGRDLDEGPQGPWLEPLCQRGKFSSVFQPVIQFEPKIWSTEKQAKTNNLGVPSDVASATRRPYAQSASLLASRHYGQFLSLPLMRIDPFYALHDLFIFCSSAENQFLNALRYKVKSSFSHSNDEKYLQQSLDNFRYHKNILRSKIERFEDIINCIRLRGNRKWHTWQPSAQSPAARAPIPLHPSNKDKENAILQGDADASAVKILQDYEALLQKAIALSRLYNEELDELRTSAALLEAKKSVEQAESIGRLSWLAFLFLPLSLTAALFGMNFKEIGTNLSIWIYPALSVPVFLLTLLIYFWPNAYQFVQINLARSGSVVSKRDRQRLQRSTSKTADADAAADV